MHTCFFLLDHYLFVTHSLADEDRPFVNLVIREDLPASAVNSDNEEFVTALCCEVLCYSGCCANCCGSDGDEDADADDDDGNNNDPDVFVSSWVWEV